MLFNDVSDAGSAAITRFRSFSVENLTVLVLLGEVFPHKLNEQFTNINFYILTIWWLKPYDPAISIF